MDSWFSYGNTNKEYFLSTIKKKYTDADKECKAKGAMLAKIVSKDMAMDFRKAYNNKIYMMDLNDKKEGNYLFYNIYVCTNICICVHDYVCARG